jgi:hypothetical protein
MEIDGYHRTLLYWRWQAEQSVWKLNKTFHCHIMILCRNFCEHWFKTKEYEVFETSDDGYFPPDVFNVMDNLV